MRTIFTAFFVTLASLVSAQDDDPFGITLYGSFLHTAKVPNALFFFNYIEQGDSFELRRALRNHDIDTVVLGSNGGAVMEGLNMAGIIFDKEIFTYVPELPNEMGCYSACAFMFFGGKIRQADGVLAVHQSGYYGSDVDKSKQQVSEVQQNTQLTVSEIIGFLNEFETPPWVYEKMFRSRDFYIFNDDEKDRLSSQNTQINRERLYAINNFIESFFNYLGDLETNDKKQKPGKPKDTDIVPSDNELKLMVAEIQKLLNLAGCNAGAADGVWGRKTQAAAVLFAKTAKLPHSRDELISQEFISKLRAVPTNFCPKVTPKKKVLVSLAGSWSGDIYCNGTKYQISGSVTKKTDATYSFTMRTADYTYVGTLITTNNGKNFSMDAIDQTRREFKASGIVSSNGKKLNGQTIKKTCPFVFNKN